MAAAAPPMIMDVSSFPLTALQCIFNYLSGPDILECSMVNHHWYAATCGHVLWRSQCEREYLLEDDTTCVCAQQEGTAIRPCLLKKHYLKYMVGKRRFCLGTLETHHFPINLKNIRLCDCNGKRMVVCYGDKDMDIWQLSDPLFLSFRSNEFAGTIDVRVCKDILYLLYQNEAAGTSKQSGGGYNLFMYRIEPSFAMELPQTFYARSTDLHVRATGVKLLPLTVLNLFIYNLQWYATAEYILYFNMKTDGLSIIRHETGNVSHKPLPPGYFDVDGTLFQDPMFYFIKIIPPRCDGKLFALDCSTWEDFRELYINYLCTPIETKIHLSVWKTDFILVSAKDKIVMINRNGIIQGNFTWFSYFRSTWLVPKIPVEGSDFFRSLATAKTLAGRDAINFATLDYVISPYGAMVLADHGSYFHFISRNSGETNVKSVEWNPPGYVQIKAKRDIWHISRRCIIMRSEYREILFIILFIRDAPVHFQ